MSTVKSSSEDLTLNADGSGNDVVIQSDGTTKAIITAEGRLGIGTTSFSYGKLEVAESGYVASAVRSSDASGAIAFLAANSSSEVRMGAISNHPLSIRTNNAERMRIDTSGNLKYNSGYGSVATAYGCRAWVKFNGTGTVAIYNSANVSSITDLATGRYQANFTTAMVDANYTAVCTNANKEGGCYSYVTSSVNMFVGQSAQDSDPISLAIFR